MLNIYLVRHGETEWNTQKRMQGWDNSDLTEKGIEAASALHHHFIDIEFDAVYSSTSGRAYRTAEIIVGERNIEIIKDDNLREIFLGDWQGKTAAEIEKISPQQHYNFFSAPHLYNRENSETLPQVQERALKTINKIVKDNKTGNVLIVTHGVTLKLIMAYFEKRHLKDLWEPPYILNTSVSLIQFDKDNANIKMYADTSHIELAY